MVSKQLQRFYVFLVLLFLYAPIVVLIVFSFNASKSTANWSGFSLQWYVELFQDRQIMKALYYTLTVAVIASAAATVIGTFAAYGITNMQALPKRALLALNNIPILNPDIVTGVALLAMFTFINMPLGFVTMLLAHITFAIPFVILSVLPKFKQLPQDILEAAMDLGATPGYAFFKVILPEIMPGIVTGFLIAFTLSVDDFVISFFTTGGGVTNLSIEIYAMARRGIKPIINALSTLMFITVLVMMLIISLRMDKDAARKGEEETPLLPAPGAGSG